MYKIFYAYSKEGEPPEGCPQFDQHPGSVAEIAKGFAEEFRATKQSAKDQQL